jgi:hypothetical protein
MAPLRDDIDAFESIDRGLVSRGSVSDSVSVRVEDLEIVVEKGMPICAALGSAAEKLIEPPYLNQEQFGSISMQRKISDCKMNVSFWPLGLFCL